MLLGGGLFAIEPLQTRSTRSGTISDTDVLRIGGELDGDPSAEDGIALADGELRLLVVFVGRGERNLFNAQVAAIEDERLAGVLGGAFDVEEGETIDGPALEIDTEAQLDMLDADVFGIGVGVKIAN